jgi:hypothetical protein
LAQRQDVVSQRNWPLNWTQLRFRVASQVRPPPKLPPPPQHGWPMAEPHAAQFPPVQQA